jgi:hypothetical protein
MGLIGLSERANWSSWLVLLLYDTCQVLVRSSTWSQSTYLKIVFFTRVRGLGTHAEVPWMNSHLLNARRGFHGHVFREWISFFTWLSNMILVGVDYVLRIDTLKSVLVLSFSFLVNENWFFRVFIRGNLILDPYWTSTIEKLLLHEWWLLISIGILFSWL